MIDYLLHRHPDGSATVEYEYLRPIPARYLLDNYPAGAGFDNYQADRYAIADFGRLAYERVRGAVHILPNGDPCFCPGCIRERNENAEINQDLLHRFRAQVGRPSQAVPARRCLCGACSWGKNALEGCLYPNEPTYAKIEARAAGLLREMLTDSQWECWENEDFFPVVGSNGVTYRIYRMPTYNVLNTQTMVWLCTLPRTERWGDGHGLVPPSDGRIAQMLMLMTNALEFEGTANKSHSGCMHPNGWVPPDLATRPGDVIRYGANHLAENQNNAWGGNGYGQRLAP